MVTIEDKLRFFKELVDKKLDEQKREAIEKVDKELIAFIEESKKEFIKESEDILSNYKRQIQKEKLQIMSKAKVEEKKIILKRRKEIFNEVIEGVLEYTKGFLNTDQYKNFVLNSLKKVSSEMRESQLINLYFTERDIKCFKEHVLEIFKGKSVEFYIDDEILGGFVIEDKERNLKFDLSLIYKIHSSRDIIGEKLFKFLQ